MELDTTERCMHVVLEDEWPLVADFISVSSEVLGGISGDQAAW
jgi:hypothetical protein